jgi:hypothetical protein
VQTPEPSLQQAFDRVMVKARWGVIGAILGAALLSAMNYFSRDESRPAFMAVVGLVTGAFGGAALGAGGLRAIGFSMMACIFVGFCCCPGTLAPRQSLTEEGLLLILTCCVATGFLIGTVIEFAPYWGYKQPHGSSESGARTPPDDHPTP